MRVHSTNISLGMGTRPRTHSGGVPGEGRDNGFLFLDDVAVAQSQK